MIDAKCLTKTFGSRCVINSISLDVQARECVLVHGAANSGKTTLVRLLAGVIAPTTGTLRIAGSHASPTEIRRHAALCDLSLLGGSRLRVDEYLRWLSKATARSNSLVRPLVAPDLAARRARLLPSRRVDTLRLHDRAALALAAAAVLPATVLLLDEVVDAFAADRQGDFLDWIRELQSEGATLIVTSRRTHGPQSLFTSVLHLHDGRISEFEADGGHLRAENWKGYSSGLADLA